MIDAIVVGAGLSGLVCAHRLTEAGARVLVLEARDRVGGRLLSGRVGDATVDLGGQWLSVGQPRLAALAAELGVATIPQARDGRSLLDGGAGGWWRRLATAFAQWRGVRRIGRLTAAIAVDPVAAMALDDVTLAAWLAREVADPSARERFAMHAALVFAAEPADLSLLRYLATLAATGGFAPAGPDLPGGGREHRFEGGAQTLALRIATTLGEAVQLATPVTEIVDAGDHVRAGERSARRLVLAVSPLLARRIALGLPAMARELVDRSQVGGVVKCFAAYDRAFWREAGWSGEAYRPRGTVRATVALEPSPILLAFVVGAAAAAWSTRDPDERRADVLATLAEQFGEPAASPVDYREIDWGTDPWSAGCVAGVTPGALAAGAAWGAPHGRIHFAGTETAVAWPGYMEGAIEAGERAAREVLDALAVPELPAAPAAPALPPLR